MPRQGSPPADLRHGNRVSPSRHRNRHCQHKAQATISQTAASTRAPAGRLRVSIRAFADVVVALAD